MGSASAYGVGGTHRHTPEIVQNLSGLTDEQVKVSFTPVLVPMPRGILATASASRRRRRRRRRRRAPPTRRRTPTSRSCTCSPRASGPPPSRSPGPTASTSRSTLDEAAGRVVAVGAVDNLAKGTGGAAVQCMNLALGLPEQTGLSTVGLAP